MHLLRMTTLPHSPINFGSKSIEYVVLITNQWDSGSLSSRCVGTSCKNQCPKVCVWTGRSGLAMNYKIRLRDYWSPVTYMRNCKNNNNVKQKSMHDVWTKLTWLSLMGAHPPTRPRHHAQPTTEASCVKDLRGHTRILTSYLQSPNMSCRECDTGHAHPHTQNNTHVRITQYIVCDQENLRNIIQNFVSPVVWYLDLANWHAKYKLNLYIGSVISKEKQVYTYYHICILYINIYKLHIETPKYVRVKDW